MEAIKDMVDKYNSIVSDDMSWSNMHIVIADGNMDDDDILWCMEQGVTGAEKIVCNFLLSIPVQVREYIWENA